MPTIQVVKPFTLQLDPVIRKTVHPSDPSRQVEEVLPSELQFFDIGIYDVADSVAEHWYVQAHLKGYQEPAKGPGTAEFAMAQAQKPIEEAGKGPADQTQPMPPDARAPRQAPIPAHVRRAEPIA